MNRRNFLKKLGGGALAAAAVPLLPVLPKVAETVQLGFKPDWVMVTKTSQYSDTWYATGMMLYGAIPPGTIVSVPNKVVRLTEKGFLVNPKEEA